MPSSIARIPTVNGSRYLQQLAKHWGHHFKVDFTPQRADIDFGDSNCRLDAEDDALIVKVTGAAEGFEGLETIVADHIQRFAHREPDLQIPWRREA
ncbi:hypothetical protein PMI01_03021 [Caulobacter sp. AP07]|uniref:DUF2218 domain-containing protein n=1 Tax=Caulobacter sp. AP07 TaxID=1144304 RepID=UPI000271EDD6|nr:DUF2218 domain-containing protein [Caulobacter sp. AP07]EJL30798.1 hypothetical protein PMI01_03021 [Caulobacter sp. AP07]